MAKAALGKVATATTEIHVGFGEDFFLLIARQLH